ncbi:serine hydrolase domain-containing protein [Sphingomonas cavernae]|nr:serine hydrolase domain-containing protein [Sphingomonas cavernae]
MVMRDGGFWRGVSGRERSFACLAALALATLPATALADDAPAAKAVAVKLDRARLDGLEEFVNGVMAQQLANREVAGAVISVVYKGKLLFARGYGYADVDRAIPVDGERTLFRPGSVSKLLTWTALMQQVEQGQVSLDDDINKYLDFRIPDTQSRPILVRHLLDHTPGFEDSGVGMMSKTPADFVALGPWLRDHIPTRVREPGVETSYSNYGSAIAGYIVERVSGEAFPDYVDRHILQPLGMASTTFREPLSGVMAENMALGYALTDGRFVAKPFELYHNVMPAGSVSATAPDMAKFMIAQLHDGRLGKAQILKPETARLMRGDLMRNAPALPGMGYGYMVVREQGPRLIGHGGNTADFHSFMLLAPEADFGFFVSTTGGPGSYPARTELMNALIGRVFPQAPAPRWTGAATPAPVGAYRTNRRTYSEPPRPEFDIKVSAAGERAITLEIMGARSHWEQIGPDLYEQVTGARSGGPYERVEFYGPDSDRKMSFGSQPHVLYRLVHQ